MTIRELVAELISHPLDLEVVLAGDAKGNYFRKLDGGLSTGHYDRTRHYQVVDEGDWRDVMHEEKDYPGDNCVVLWPE